MGDNRVYLSVIAPKHCQCIKLHGVDSEDQNESKSIKSQVATLNISRYIHMYYIPNVLEIKFRSETCEHVFITCLTPK